MYCVSVCFVFFKKLFTICDCEGSRMFPPQLIYTLLSAQVSPDILQSIH